MPDTQYVPRRHPPTPLDNLFLHPLSFALSSMSMFVGFQVLLSMMVDQEVSRGLSESSFTVQLLTGLLLTISGPLMMLGMFNPLQKFSKLTAMVIKRSGATGLTAGWWSFGLAVVFTGNQFGTITAQSAIAIGSGFFLQAISIYLRERQVRQALAVQEAANGPA